MSSLLLKWLWKDVLFPCSYCKLEKEWQYMTAKYQCKRCDAMRARKRKESLQIFRLKLMDILGGRKCIKCGFEKDYRALHFVHINGGGIKDRKRRTSDQYYLNYIQNPDIAKKTLQVLCANCNCIKWFEKNENGVPRTKKYY